jgi:hypothetical protein
MSNNTYQQLLQEIHKVIRTDGTGVFNIARVIGTNDPTNTGKVRIYPINEYTKTWRYLESKYVEVFPWAEVLSPAKGENHGYHYTPEFGDYVIYSMIGNFTFIIGSIEYPGYKHASETRPVEVQNNQPNGLEYCSTFYPNLTLKGYHRTNPMNGDHFQPAAFLQRFRKNDFLIYNMTKVGKEPMSAIKLMEMRSSENSFIQIVDIGNNNIKPGLLGVNAKKYSPVRQTDYRDLWEGFNVNKEFWKYRSDKPPLSNESQYIKIATNGYDYKESPMGDTGKDLPDKTRGEIRWDNRLSDGSFETTKTYCPVYQMLKVEAGDPRYLQDKSGSSSFSDGIPYSMKVKKYIMDFGNPYDPEAQHFNVGHYLTLSNTIYKRRVMLSSKKGHQLVFSDIDKDEKILLNSHRGKYLYMEDSSPQSYDGLWLASQKHHMLFVDWMFSPYLIDSDGKERHRLLDPNQGDKSTFQLIQTGNEQKIWMADSENCPRIHIHSTDGHEFLLLDHDNGKKSISPTPHQGKIQITTSDKQMQITMDVENGDISIQNHNMSGKGKTGDISLYAKHNIKLHSENVIEMRADKGYDIQSKNGPFSVTACAISLSEPPNCGAKSVPENIRPTVLTKIETTEGSLINKYDPS